MLLGDTVITLIWLFIILLLVIIELITVNLTTIWLIFGAIVSLTLNYFNVPFYIQFISFIGVSVLLYLFLKPAIEEKIYQRRVKYFNNNIHYKKGKVSKTILPNMDGEIKIEGKRWVARANDSIEVGEIVRIKKRKGLVLIVERVKKAKKK